MTGDQMVGLRHIIEDGIAILEGGTISTRRREYVLSELSQLLDAAGRGSKLVRENAWVIAPSDREAFESFSIIETYLDSYADEELDHSLSMAKHSIEQARVGKGLPKEEVQGAKEFLKDLLRCIQQDGRSTTPQRSDTRIALND